MSELQTPPWHRVVLATAGMVGGIGLLAYWTTPKPAHVEAPIPASVPAPEKYYFTIDSKYEVVTLDCATAGELKLAKKFSGEVQTFIVRVVDGEQSDAARFSLFPKGSDFRYLDWRSGPVGGVVIPRQEFESPEGSTLHIGEALVSMVVSGGQVAISADCIG